MLANASAIAGQFSGVGRGVAEPVRHPQSHSGDGEVVGLVYRLSDLDDHQARLLLPEYLGGRGSVAGVRGDRHHCRAHRPPEAGRGGLRLGGDPQRRRALRPDQHPDRRGVRHRSGVPPPVRGGSGARRHRHRRHRARAHREGPRLPAGGDEGRGLSRDLPHGGDSARGLAPAARGAGRHGFGQPRRRGRGPAAAGRLHRGPAATGDLSGPGDQGHQLERHRTGHRPGWGRAALGLPALLQGRSALDQLAGSDIRRDAPGHW